MSLLNDMLRDLSQRQQPVSNAGDEHDFSLLQSTNILRKPQKSWLMLAAVFVLVFVMVLGGRLWLHKVIQHPQTAILQDQQASAVALVTSLSSTAENTLQAPQPTYQSDPTQEQIRSLLQQAERALVADRLTLPVEDSAYGYYQKILAIAPKQPEAQAGVDAIAARYLDMAREQLQQGNKTQANVLINRAKFVAEAYTNAHLAAIVSVAPPDKSVAIPQGLSAAQVSSNESVSTFEVAQANTLSVTPSAGWKDEQLARHAQELILKGKVLEAQGLLKDFIATETAPARSAAVLADIYLQQENIESVQALLVQASYLSEITKAKVLAQVLVLQGKDAEAIALLEKHLAAAESDESYRALLASLYHKTANYQQSVINYQRLLNTYGEKPAYWLGLALAYDGLGQSPSALQAYLHLREFPQLQPQVATYIDQRISALRSQ